MKLFIFLFLSLSFSVQAFGSDQDINSRCFFYDREISGEEERGKFLFFNIFEDKMKSTSLNGIVLEVVPSKAYGKLLVSVYDYENGNVINENISLDGLMDVDQATLVNTDDFYVQCQYGLGT